MCHALLRGSSGGLSCNRTGHSLSFEATDLQLKKEVQHFIL